MGRAGGANTAVGEVIHQSLLESREAGASFSACPAWAPTSLPPCQLPALREGDFLQNPGHSLCFFSFLGLVASGTIAQRL